MRWADCIRQLFASSPHTAGRHRLRLAVHSLEERAVPNAAGTQVIDRPIDPAAIVKEQPAPAPTDGGSAVVVNEMPAPVDGGSAVVVNETPAPVDGGSAVVVNETPAPDDGGSAGVVKDEPAPADGGTPKDDTVIIIDDLVVEPVGGTSDAIAIQDSANVPLEEKILDTNADGSPQIYTMTAYSADPPKPPRPRAPYPQIGDRVWRDLNGNGMQEAGEPGIPFVTLQLFQGSTLVGSTTTDGVGAYAFNLWNVKNGTVDPGDDGLQANMNYQIRIAGNQSTLIGLRPTLANIGTTNADERRDSDATAAAAGATIDFTMGPDEIYSHYDFGYTPAATVGDLVWLDANNNGKKDKNEAGMQGVTVRLLDAFEGIEVATTTTGTDGKYLFTGLMPGRYVVEVAANNFTASGALVGYTSSSGKVGEGETQIIVKGDNLDHGTSVNGTVRGTAVTVLGESLDNRTQDFGFFRATSLSGQVYLDKNGNGRIDPEDTTGLPKMRIRIAGPAGTFTATTNDDGNYQFKNLLPGTYSVVELNQPTAYRSTTPNLETITLVAGSVGTTNFGEAQAVDLRLTQITGREWVNVGGYLTLTYRVRNMGSLSATGVVITAPLPVGYKVIGSDTMVNASYERLTQRATIGTLAPGAEAVVKIRVQSNRAGVVRLKATVQANEPEEDMRNNQSAVVVTTATNAPSIIPRWLFSRG